VRPKNADLVCQVTSRRRRARIVNGLQGCCECGGTIERFAKRLSFRRINVIDSHRNKLSGSQAILKARAATSVNIGYWRETSFISPLSPLRAGNRFPTVLTHQPSVSIGNLKIPFTPLIVPFRSPGTETLPAEMGNLSD